MKFIKRIPDIFKPGTVDRFFQFYLVLLLFNVPMAILLVVAIVTGR